MFDEMMIGEYRDDLTQLKEITNKIFQKNISCIDITHIKRIRTENDKIQSIRGA